MWRVKCENTVPSPFSLSIIPFKTSRSLGPYHMRKEGLSTLSSRLQLSIFFASFLQGEKRKCLKSARRVISYNEAAPTPSFCFRWFSIQRYLIYRYNVP